MLKKILTLFIAFLGFMVSSHSVSASKYGSKEWLQELEAMMDKEPAKKPEPWIDPVAVAEKHIGKNRLGITKDDIAVKVNDAGKGFFIFVPHTRFHGVERKIIWFVKDNSIIKLNGAAHLVTPKLPWPQDVSPTFFDGTGLNPQNITEIGLKQAFNK